MIGQSEKSGIEIESEYQLTGHPVKACQEPGPGKCKEVNYIYDVRFLTQLTKVF